MHRTVSLLLGSLYLLIHPPAALGGPLAIRCPNKHRKAFDMPALIIDACSGQQRSSQGACQATMLRAAWCPFDTARKDQDTAARSSNPK